MNKKFKLEKAQIAYSVKQYLKDYITKFRINKVKTINFCKYLI